MSGGAVLREACATNNTFKVSKVIEGANDQGGMRPKILNGVTIGMVHVPRQTLRDVVNEPDAKTRNAPIHLCCIHDSSACLKLLLDTGVCDVTQLGNSAFSAAAICADLGRLECLRLLLESAEGRRIDLAEAQLVWSSALGGHASVLKLLLGSGSGAAVNRQNGDGNTALHLALMADHVEAATILLAHGADKTIYNNSMALPIDVCISERARDLCNLSQEEAVAE